MSDPLQRLRGEEPDYGALIDATLAVLDGRAKLVVRPDLRVLWRSEGATGLLAEPAPLVLAGDYLRFPASNRGKDALQFLERVEDTPGRHLLRAEAKGHWALLQAWRLPVRHRAIAIVCTLSTLARGVAASGLAEELRLTRSETGVLDLFARLQTPQQIADGLGISVATVRSHLKQIYAKAEVESAVQLLRLTAGYCA